MWKGLNTYESPPQEMLILSWQKGQMKGHEREVWFS